MANVLNQRLVMKRSYTVKKSLAVKVLYAGTKQMYNPNTNWDEAPFVQQRIGKVLVGTRQYAISNQPADSLAKSLSDSEFALANSHRCIVSRCRAAAHVQP